MESQIQVIDKKVSFDFPVEILKQVEESGEFHVVGYAATTDFDLQGDIITEEALRASQLDLLKNSTVLLNHDVTIPIGRVTKAEFDQHGLLIDVLISKTEPDIIQKIKEGVLNKFSIRGQVLEREKKFMPEYDRVVNVIKRMALVEVSLVSVPANPEAKAIGWYVSKALADSDREVTTAEPDGKKSQGGNSMPAQDVELEEISTKGDVHPGGATTEVPGKEAPPAEEVPPTETSPSENSKNGNQSSPEPGAGNPDGDSAKGKAAASDNSPGPEPETKKQWPDALRTQLQPVFFLLDKISAMGGQAGPIAQQITAMLKQIVGDTAYPYPSSYPPPKVKKEELDQLISSEVKKQLDALLKGIPTLRKGLIQREPDPDDVKKQFESLAPEKKLKVALALQQS